MRTYNGVELFKPTGKDELSAYGAKLANRFKGDRYKAFVTMDELSGEVSVAEVQVFDLHSPQQLLFNKDRTRFWLVPVFRTVLHGRTDDGSPYIGEATDQARRFLAKYDPYWQHSQGTYGYICVDCAVMPADEMDNFLYGILLN